MHLPKDQPDLTVDGLRRERFGQFSLLHRAGRGEGGVTVHFAHATGFNAETYRVLLASLDPWLDVYAMDARGHGRSQAEAEPSKLRSWRRYRRDLEAFVETLRRPIVLAGHSMGATVSLEVAARRPELIEGLVLVDPVIVPPLQIPLLALARPLGLAGRLIPISQAAARRRTEFPSREAAVENFLGKGPFRTWPREWIEAYVDGGTDPVEGDGVRLSCDRAWESKTFATSTVNPYWDIKKLRCPITLLAREHAGPPFTRASRDMFLRLQPDTRLVVVEGASHFITMERPDLACEEIERIAEKVRSKLG
jgi:pimeloyl-ACP methyl ester carboxylesterase